MITLTLTFIALFVVASLCYLVLRKYLPIKMAMGRVISMGRDIPDAVAQGMVIAILALAPGMLYAQGQHADDPSAASDDMLPGVIQPWSISMPSESDLRARGATMADARAFARKLQAIADVVTQAPGYNPVPAGCDIQISGKVDIVVNKTTKKLRRFSGDLLIGCLPFDVEIRNGKKVRGGYGETRNFFINVNKPNSISHGHTWSDGKGNFSLQPKRTGEFGGMPVYSRVNEYYEGGLVENPSIVIAKPDQQIFRPVGRERAMKAFITELEKDQALHPDVELSKQMLASLTPEQRTEPACFYRDNRRCCSRTAEFPGIKERGITPVGFKECILIMQTSVMNNDLPPTAVQLIVFSNYEDIMLHGETARKKGETPTFFFEATATALRRVDWQKLAAMIDRP